MHCLAKTDGMNHAISDESHTNGFFCVFELVLTFQIGQCMVCLKMRGAHWRLNTPHQTGCSFLPVHLRACLRQGPFVFRDGMPWRERERETHKASPLPASSTFQVTSTNINRLGIYIGILHLLHSLHSSLYSTCLERETVSL